MSSSPAESNTLLGRDVDYLTTYTPSLLQSIHRESARRHLGIDADALPFLGEDVWNCYELSWLSPSGRPEVAAVQVRAPCTSSAMVESKSLKLYLNSFSQTQFQNKTEVLTTIDSDLRVAFLAPVIVSLLDVAQMDAHIGPVPGASLDEKPIDITNYDLDPSTLGVASEVVANEVVHTHLFRSVCPVTGQPDWASVVIEYLGPRIDHEGLLKYLVSYRNHPAFHEDTIERIYTDMLARCECDRLTVYGRFLRRGGIDINPFRSTHETVAPDWRVARQ